MAEHRFSRRRFLLRSAQLGLAAGAAGLTVAGLRAIQPPWDPRVFAPPGSASVAVLRAGSYGANLETIVRDGIRAVGVDVSGRSILLKPNMVEFDAGSAINTDPRLVVATASALRGMGARSVTVGEGPGHRRDTEYVVAQSGLLDLLRDLDAPFVDLNLAPVRRVPLHSSYTALGELWLPTPVLDADLVVSMPKLKTHHWGGVTLSLKNLFGTVPGRIYGWPKNVLHWAGLEDSILDVAGAVRPGLVIIDGIVGMEGDGPIEGNAVEAGHIVVASDPVAADVTGTRLMGLDPERVGYLVQAGRFLGQARWDRIIQVGEDPEADAVEFALLDQWSHLRIGSPPPTDDPGEATSA